MKAQISTFKQEKVLLLDCEIFVDLRIAFVWSSTFQQQAFIQLASCRHPPAAIRASLWRGHCWRLSSLYHYLHYALWGISFNLAQASSSPVTYWALTTLYNSLSVATTLFSEDVSERSIDTCMLYLQRGPKRIHLIHSFTLAYLL